MERTAGYRLPRVTTYHGDMPSIEYIRRRAPELQTVPDAALPAVVAFTERETGDAYHLGIAVGLMVGVLGTMVASIFVRD